MCLALIALDAHPRFAVIIAANRDEHHARPAAPAAWWDEGWIAGRDLEAGGTWLGVTRTGRWALLTNIREPGRKDPAAPTRGALVTRTLADPRPPGASVAAVAADAAGYNGFNLLAGDTESAHWGSNRTSAPVRLAPGIHGVSNAALDAPWPKVVRTKSAFSAWCAESGDRFEPLFALLGDTGRAPDSELPATGVSLEWERLLSSPFIVGERFGYGTRSSTVLALGRDGDAVFIERTFDPAGRRTGEVEFRFALAVTTRSAQ